MLVGGRQEDEYTRVDCQRADGVVLPRLGSSCRQTINEAILKVSARGSALCTLLQLSKS
jgi:hypothetical protein